MIKHAKRLDSVEEYYFSKKLREVSKMIALQRAYLRHNNHKKRKL